jgi:hypothetical protein
MSYVRPEEVLSPKNRVVRIVEVIHDAREGGMSVARILWREEEDEEKEVIAIRWNGGDRLPLGNPVSRGHATWFVVDDYAAPKVEEAARREAEKSPSSLVAKYREMANDSEREREAEEWSEGLIADASAQR